MAGPYSPDFDRCDDKGLDAALPPSTNANLRAADVCLIHLDLAAQYSRPGWTIARRSLCRIVQAVS